MSIGKAIAIIGGVAVGAIGAYNFSSTGCFLGSCGTDEAAASATTNAAVQTVADAEPCPLGCSMEGEALAAASESCCSESSEAIELVSADAGSCCSSVDKVAAMTVAATESAESSCCAAEGEAVAAAESCCSEAADDAECDASACTKGDACCQQVASNDD
jgi:hypothetical protein